MTQEITVAVDTNRLAFIKEYVEEKGTTLSNVIDNYLKTLQEIDEAKKKKTLHPWVQEFGGMVNTGREENTETIYE